LGFVPIQITSNSVQMIIRETLIYKYFTDNYTFHLSNDRI